VSAKPKYRKMQVSLPNRELTLYAGKKVGAAITEVTDDMTLYKGVRFVKYYKQSTNKG
jgi:hypothetical protein